MDEQALIARATEERERLFQRYERGREPGAEIDPWEDPGFEVYHQTDRYGFIHDKRLPQKIDPNEAKSRAIEMERVKKWLKMLNKWNQKETQEKLHKRIYKGIPDKLRSQVWMKLLNIEKTMAEKKNVYQNMLKLARQWSTEARQIDSDVNRQFREHLFYRERYSIKQRSLFNVLTAYSMYNMEVGYCQGMSGVAGVLLMYMDEEEAFWALSTLLADKKYAMHGLYIEGFPKLNRLVHHHDRLIEKFLPKIKKHFDLHSLDSMIYSLKWFFVIFIERIPFSLCLRVWDIYLLDGEKVVTAMAYTILRLHQKKLVKLKDMDLLVQYLQTKLHKDFGYDDDYVIKALEQSMEELRKAKLDLAPSPPDTEFPKRPFGVFVEPAVETKIGRRKSSFTETEKEVTENVILRRDKTQQELSESRISDGGLGGSNSQLNNTVPHKDSFHTDLDDNWEFLRAYKALPSRLHVRDNKQFVCIMDTSEHYSSLPTRLLHGNIPESEDGGSLLGSSRKSLADTSVTSTADLSVFSTGQRSQQFDICVDDMRSMRSDADGEGESSPGSAFGSLSIVGRTPSAMMITPTPRAISPHDIVRIYVPPAPPDESGKLLNELTTKMTTPKTIDNKNLIKSPTKSTQNYPLRSNSIDDTSMPTSSSNGASGSNRNSIVSGEITPIRRSFVYRSDEELAFNGLKSSSSSRRGSLSRKSPSILGETSLLLDCEHLRNKRRSIDMSDDNIDRYLGRQNSSNSNVCSVGAHKSNGNGAGGIGSSSGISSLNSNNSTGGLRRTKLMTSFEELARLRKEQYQRYGYITDNRMTKSIHCDQPTGTSDDDDLSPKSKYGSDYNIQYKALGRSTSPLDHDFVPIDVSKALRKKSDNSDEYSSSSPNTRSVLTTPVNEQIPISILTSSQSTQKLLASGETTPTYNTIGTPSTAGILSTATISISPLSKNTHNNSTNRFNASSTSNQIDINNRRHKLSNDNLSNDNNLTNLSTQKQALITQELPSSSSTSSRSHSRSRTNSYDRQREYQVEIARNSVRTQQSQQSQMQQQPQQQFISNDIRYDISNTSNNTRYIQTSTSSTHDDFDRRLAAPIGGPYDYKNHSNSSRDTNTNKIRIKVHQNQ